MTAIQGPRRRGLTEQETIKQFRHEHNLYMLSVGFAKAIGGFIGFSFVWLGLDGMFAAMFDDYGLFPVILGVIGVAIAAIGAIVWWAIEWREPWFR